jgi:hypothetical protein
MIPILTNEKENDSAKQILKKPKIKKFSVHKAKGHLKNKLNSEISIQGDIIEGSIIGENIKEINSSPSKKQNRFTKKAKILQDSSNIYRNPTHFDQEPQQEFQVSQQTLENEKKPTTILKDSFEHIFLSNDQINNLNKIKVKTK